MSLALAYGACSPEVRIELEAGATARARLPSEAALLRFVASVLEARCGDGEALSLFGEDAATLDAARRQALRLRVGVLTPRLRLISNLNAWENISLGAAYHGAPPLERVARTASEVLQAFGAKPSEVLARLPGELGSLERKLVAFARLLAAEPELAILDSVDRSSGAGRVGLSQRFEAEYRARQPAGSVLHVDSEEEQS